MIRRLQTVDVHGRPSKPTANFRRVRAGPTMFLLFGRAYPDLTIAKDYGVHVLKGNFLPVRPSSLVTLSKLG